MERRKTCIAASVVGILLCATASAQVTERESVNSGGTQANLTSYSNAISGDGRYLVFESIANNLVSGDTNGARDIFVRDRVLGTTQRVNVSSSGVQSNGSDFWNAFVAISANGRFAAFATNGSNLVPGDTNAKVDVFLRDLQLGVTERISVDSSGVQGNGESRQCAVSADGRFVAFMSVSSNLVLGDTNGGSDIFVRDRQSGTTERVSVATGGAQGNSNCQDPAISADGRYVAFVSYSSNLVVGDTNGMPDIFVRDRQTGTTERVTIAQGGAQINGSCASAAISGDGRFVAYESSADNIVANDTNSSTDIFVYDRQTGTTERVSVSTSGAEANQGTLLAQYPSPGLSADGRYVVFTSASSNLINGDTNTYWDVFVRDRLLGTTQRVSVGTESIQGNGYSFMPSISADGRFVSFTSDSNNFAGEDTNSDYDIFVRDADPTVFTSLCEPGLDGVIPCPCGNPPAGPDRGCNNFAPAGGTGGAKLGGSGTPSMSLDTVSLDISDTLKSIHMLFVGTALTANVRTGAGVRCVASGANAHAQSFLKRLAKQTPTNGPPSTMSFAGIQATSAAKGVPVMAGETYYYYAAYRNSAANGAPGCSGFSFGFNATNAGSVTWYP